MPKGYDVVIVRDQSIFIEASVDTVEEHLMIGGGLAAIVVFFFLANVRATVIAALSIPTSIIAAFAIINYMGFTLNSLTLLALTLSVGIVIDDAIVVMENIFRYIEEKKYTPYEAAIAATGEIGLAVMAITLSLVAVFLPIAMMEGIVGRFLKSFGITMAATIMVSMLVSFTLTPMLAARWFKKPKEGKVTTAGTRPFRSRREGAAGWGRRPTAAKRRSPHPRRRRPQRERGRKAAARRARCSIAPSSRSIWSCLRFSLRQRWLVVLAVDRLHGHAADVVPGAAEELHSRRGLVGVSIERSGPGGNVAGGHAGDALADRPRHPHA